jgi:predicted nucleic acid-binding protein
MIFVDTSVILYAVGREHPLKEESRGFFREQVGRRSRLVTSAEVLQELIHAYLPVGRLQTLESALELVDACFADVWPIEAADVRFARLLVETHPGLGPRDLLHLACCRRREVHALRTFSSGLAAAFARGHFRSETRGRDLAAELIEERREEG